MKVISFVGVKPGVGASSTVVNVALRLQKLGERVCVVDAAPDGNADVSFLLGNTHPLRSSSQLISHRNKLLPSQVPDYLAIPRLGLSAVQLNEDNSWSDLISMLSPFSIVLVDGYSPCLDHVMLVVSPDPMVLRALRVAMEKLHKNLVSSQRITILINSYEIGDISSEDVVRNVCATCQVHRVQSESELMRLATLSGSPLSSDERVVGIIQDWDRIANVVRTLPDQGHVCDVDYAALHKRLLTAFQDCVEVTDRTIASQEVRSLLAKIPEAERANIDADSLIEDVVNDALGLGLLEPIMQDPSITEIMINGSRQIYVEQHGRLSLLPDTLTAESLQRIVERILAPLGRRVDESTPMVDARLPDGSRVNIVIPPLSLNGPIITIRRFSPVMWRLDDLVRMESLSLAMAETLRSAIANRNNIIISGGTGSGKTTLLNVLSSEISDNERIITIEDAAELRLTQSHVLRLESRPENLEGKGAVSIRDLVKNALRMRPNRIIVGECRGAEALDMLQAMNTGHDGSLTTLHANSPKAALSRLETLVMFAGMDLPVRAIREQIAGAVQLIVQVVRQPNGRRVVTEVAELSGFDGDRIQLRSVGVVL